MNYNESLFGKKIKITQSVTATGYSFEIPSTNISLQSLYYNNTINMGDNLPDDLFYWQISSDSPYSAFSFMIRTGSSGDYKYQKYDGEQGSGNIPIVLCTNKSRRNANYNFDYDGTLDGNLDTHSYSLQTRFSSTGIKENNNNSPNWYNTETLPSTQPSQGFFNSLSFIADFNYNDIIARIFVSASDGVYNESSTLANYIQNQNISSNRIRWIGVGFYAGNYETGALSKQRFSLRTNGYNADVTPSMPSKQLTSNTSCPTTAVFTDYKYAIPPEIKLITNYSKDEIVRMETFQASNVGAMLFNGTMSNNNSQAYASYLLDESYWEYDESSHNYYLKKTGDNGIYSEADFNYIRKLIAYLGFWFTDGDNITALLGEDAIAYGDDENVPTGIYQSVIEDGVTTGEFIPLRIARYNDQSKWGNEFRDKNGYQGRTDGTSSKESSKSSKKVYTTTLPSFGNIYYRDLNMIRYLAEDLNNLITDTQNPYDPSIFYGQNPVDCIINIKEYPINISPYLELAGDPNPGTLMPIKLGRWTSGAYAQRVEIKTGGDAFAKATLRVNGKYTQMGYPFMDYEPYSSYHLYLPFCGTVKIPSELAFNTTIEVLYYADVISGSCIAHIYIDGVYYCSSQGQLAVDIPFSGYQVSQYTRDMLNATYAQKQAYANLASDAGRLISSIGGSAIGMGINAKVGYGEKNPVSFPLFSGTAGNLVNAGQVISGAGKALQAGAAMASHYETIKYNKTVLDHSAPAPIKSSLGGGIINWDSPYYVEMLIQRPAFMTGFNEANFISTLGKACYISDTLANHSGGYVEAINCNLSGFPATQPEKVELAKLLADGVFL